MIKSNFSQIIQTRLNHYYPITNFEVQLFFQNKDLENDWDNFEFWKRNLNDKEWQKSSYYLLNYIMKKEDDSESDLETDEENSELSSEMNDLELDSDMNEEDLEMDSEMSDEDLEMHWDMDDL
jgi:hypothetical protein